jgi:hypothetical protein
VPIFFCLGVPSKNAKPTKLQHLKLQQETLPQKNFEIDPKKVPKVARKIHPPKPGLRA